MIQEKLTAAFAYIRVWRTITYTALALGCVTALGWALFTLGAGLVAFYSQFGAKSAARAAQDAYVEKCNQDIQKAQQDYNAYAAALPQRLEEIKSSHAAELEQHQQAVQSLSESIRSEVNSYNGPAAIADSELKRLKNFTPNELQSLTLTAQDITTRGEYDDFANKVNSKNAQLNKYRDMIRNKIVHEYETYETPVINKRNEHQQNVNSLKQRIEALRSDAQRKIAALENRKRTIPSATFAARPERNIFGTTNVDSLGPIFDVSDTLPMMAASLSASDPLAENERRNLRMRLLNLADWLPVYTRTYAPTKADIDSVNAHNADIDKQIAEVRAELQRQLNELNSQIYTEERLLSHFNKRVETLANTKNQISQLALATSQKWTIIRAMESLLQQTSQPFPSEPEDLESKLQREKDKVPQREQAMKQRVEQLQQSIVHSKEKLDATLDRLSALERKSCALVLPAGFGISGLICISSWVGFCVLLILADYMIAPLLCATKAQETALNTCKKEN